MNEIPGLVLGNPTIPSFVRMGHLSRPCQQVEYTNREDEARMTFTIQKLSRCPNIINLPSPDTLLL